MNKGTEREDIIRAWLATEEARSLIRRAARSVLRRAREKRYSFAFIGHEAAPALENGAFLADVESQLVIFILENRRGIQEKLLLAGSKAGWVLQHGFMQDWLDATRKRESDRWRYFYKRTVDSMRSSPEFLREGSAQKEGTRFSLMGNSVSIPDLSESDYGVIGLPDTVPSSLAYDDLKHSDTILALARHFWREISAIWGGKALWVPVRSFVDWIALFVELGSEKRIEAAPDASDPVDALKDDRPLPDTLPLDEEKLVECAEKLGACLTAKEGVALWLHCGEGRSLAETAVELGYSAPSSVSYAIDKVRDKLKRFLRDLPGLSPPDLDQEAISRFWDALFSYLKKNRSKP
ncbi:MAG: hypothetical protein JXL84_23720 [Deltaproteobacteria bacterium]|nr:hypothetical protein [Deltaproteobacteria bacterium]